MIPGAGTCIDDGNHRRVEKLTRLVLLLEHYNRRHLDFMGSQVFQPLYRKRLPVYGY
jgi:hypothetical protein